VGAAGRNWLSIGSLLVAVVLFFAVNIFSSNALTGWRFDLTENNLYTLSEGTRNVLAGVDEPVTLRFFLSREAATGVPAVASYARRVEDLLREYDRYAGDALDLDIIDPEPFSEEEDLAQRHGLRGVPVRDGGESLYFGLVGSNTVDDNEVIPFFSPGREKLLEYDLTRLVYQLDRSGAPVVGLLSSLPLQGSMPMGRISGQGGQESWLITEQIEKLFSVETIDPGSGRIPDHVDVLMIAHPPELDDAMLAAIDQFVLSGGHALVFLDPYMEAEARGRGALRAQSDLEPLLDAWGATLVDGRIAADMQFAERVRYQQGQRQVIGQFPVWMNIQPSHMNGEDVVTAGLGNIFLATPGVLEPVGDAQTEFTSLIRSGETASTLEVSVIEEAASPAGIIEAYEPGAGSLTLAARLSGRARTAFPDGAAGPADSGRDAANNGSGDAAEENAGTPALESGEINVILVADADLLHEQFWARQQSLFGNQIVVPSASNADFVINALENLTGSNDLISVRSRGEFSRPFTRVEEIRRNAELEYRQKEQELLDRLEQTEQALLELQQGRRNEQDRLMLSAEQQQEIEEFRAEKVRIREELREVQHELRKDIDRLEGRLKFINIGLLPLLIGAGALAVSVQRTRRRRR